MTVGEDSVRHRKRKKHCFLAAVILLFNDRIIKLMTSLSRNLVLFNKAAHQRETIT